MRDLAVDLIAALIAFLCGLAFRPVRANVQARVARRRTELLQRIRDPSYTRDWLVGFYGGAESGQLYCYEEDGRRVATQLLMLDQWNFNEEVLEEDLLIQCVPQLHSSADVDMRTVRRKGKHIDLTNPDGSEWNELIASVSHVADEAGRPKIYVQVADYFQFLSACFPIEDETYRVVGSRLVGLAKRAKLRRRFLPSVKAAAEGRLGAQPIGMQVVVVFETSQGPYVLIQQRAQNVSSYGGALAVVPVFGCQTDDLTDGTPVSLFRNFLRETYEELYGGVEVERSGKRLDPFWFHRTPSIERLLAARRVGYLSWRLLGFGFDALNGELDIMAIAVFHRGRFTDHEFNDMKGNWEIHRIQALPLFGQDVSDILASRGMSAGSIFAIRKAREIMGGVP